MYHLPQKKPFIQGYNAVTDEAESAGGTMMDFGILLLGAGERYECQLAKERAFLVMNGRLAFTFEGATKPAERRSLFDEPPVVLHVPSGASVSILGETAAEIAVFRTTNAKTFVPRFYEKTDTRDEYRGAGTMGETSTRIVRTTFDDQNAPDANLVLGEVITFPGKWSSYPPHHHPQPEIYHYRFLPEQGFGFAMVGDEVFKVKHGDTVKILDDASHPQAAAPGYAMYYIWTIRHLADCRYGERSATPIFEPEHRWVTQNGAVIWPDKKRE